MLAYHSRGVLLSRKADFDKAAADFEEALRLDPKFAQAYFDRGVLFANREDYRKAVEDFSAVLELQPASVLAVYNRGVSRARLLELDMAVKDLTEAIRLSPEFAFAFYERAKCRVAQGKWGDALADYDESIRLSPAKNYHAERGRLHEASGRYGKALADYDAAIKLDPKYEPAHLGRATILATCPDRAIRNRLRAVVAARRLCDLSGWKDASHLALLATAYAEARNYAEAAKWLRKALEDPVYAALNGDTARSLIREYETKR